MKDIDKKDAPDVSGGNLLGPNGGCFPDPIDYPQWPLGEPVPGPDYPAPDEQTM